MLLKNHIASRFLSKDEELVMDILVTTYPEETKIVRAAHQESGRSGIEGVVDPKIIEMYALLTNRDNKNYVVTNSVISLLGMLKLSKDGQNYNWAVFKNIKEGRYTFILPDNKLLRMLVSGNVIWFIHVEQGKETNNSANLGWVMFYFDRLTGEPCEHTSHVDFKKIEPFVYSLLCFMFLTKNDEIDLRPGQKTGTKKSGKVINSLDYNITIVNSRWNTTVTSIGAFDVSGHFRLYPAGGVRLEPEIIFIAPYKKSGTIVREAKSLTHK